MYSWTVVMPVTPVVDTTAKLPTMPPNAGVGGGVGGGGAPAPSPLSDRVYGKERQEPIK
jgi:hypothetical protein